MDRNNRRRPLADVLAELVATARGDRKASLVVVNAKLVNVCTAEILEGMAVGVQEGRIAYVGRKPEKLIGPQTRVVDAAGRYLAPGFLDGHCHIESTQLTVTQFARAVLPLGTTGGFFDAHEISNVLGLKGLRLMLEEARRTPLAAYMQVASCVPSTSPELETSGASFGPEEVAEAFGWGPDMIGLGEVMNFPGVVYGDAVMLGEIEAALRAGRVADGHFTWPSHDERLIAYAASGITGDHECVTKEDVAERIRLGMYAKMRRGSAWHDVEETIKAHTELGLDPRRMMLVTDDRSVESLVDEGHMNFVIRNAIRQGVKPVTAIQMATINTAERFGVVRDVGTITPGSCADMVLLDGHLADVNVAMTICAGEVVAEKGRMVVDLEPAAYPEEVVRSVRLAGTPKPEDFVIAAPVAEGTLTARVIRVQENHVETKAEQRPVAVRGGQVDLAATAGGLCKIAVLERHHGTGGRSVALVEGIGFGRPAALAMTVAHDSHNLLVIGNDDVLMARAAARAAELQGGAVIALEDGGAELPLPIAGLLSDAPFEQVAEQSRRLSEALQDAGCRLNYAFMTLSLLALVVIPELRLSDKGLVQITAEGISRVPLFVE
ncbi:adenine deaminase [Paenibacillus mucilaginosus]|uniref:adenine deaminase n=1 Tax=Paenibacillus mucilaginosus TaxID=61624 RepID=UPI001EEFD359|nr:adenine deaminase C-terminal domain-containing protein [Paenibacillus mucilaginosus]MCG7213645.1 amidohydrolase family protein [Paenibacillus mucilaginosus]WDM27548.1 adenine deaminase [Paenibacillus mucilaginosus]